MVLIVLLLFSCVSRTSHSHIAASSSISSRLDNFLCYFSVTIASVFCWRWRWHSVVVAVKFALGCRVVHIKGGKKNDREKKKKMREKNRQDNTTKMTQTQSNKGILE